jgi:hypothetical protein
VECRNGPDVWNFSRPQESDKIALADVAREMFFKKVAGRFASPQLKVPRDQSVCGAPDQELLGSD